MNKLRTIMILNFILVSSFIISPIGINAAPPGIVNITFNQVGIGNDTTRTIFRIDNVRYLASDLPVTFNWATGSRHSVYYIDPLTAVYGKRYIFLGWENGQGMVGGQIFQELIGGYYQAPASDVVVTAMYKAQYLLTLKARTLKPAPPIQSVINIYLNGNTEGNITETKSITYWENDTSSISIGVDPTLPEINGTIYVFQRWEDGNIDNPRIISITGVTTYQAVFQAQYKVSITQPENGAIAPVETGYYNSGSSFQVVASPNLGYAFTKWRSEDKILFENSTHSTTMAVVNGPGAITAEFTDSVLVTFTANNTQSDAQGLLLTIDGNSYSYSQLPQVFRWTPDSSHAVTAQPFASVNASKRYQFIGWFGQNRPTGGTYTVPRANSTVMIRYRNQYFMETHNGGHGTITGGGWYIQGENATVMITPTIVSGGTAINWVFSGWSSTGGSGYNGFNSSFTINVKEGLNETATWISNPIQLSRGWISLLWLINILILAFGVFLAVRWVLIR